MSEGYAVKVRPEKVAAVEKIREELSASAAAMITEYRGLTVNDLKALRTRLAEAETSYRVSKNTLARRALNELGLGDLEELLEGPVAIAYVKGDPVAAAKIIATFAREHPNLVVKGGVLENRVLTADQAKDLATVDALDVSRAKIAGMLIAPLQRIMMLLEAPIARILFVLEEIAKRAPESAAATEAPAETLEAPAEASAETQVTETPPEPQAEAASSGGGEADAGETEKRAEATAESDTPPAEATAQSEETPTEATTETEGE